MASMTWRLSNETCQSVANTSKTMASNDKTSVGGGKGSKECKKDVTSTDWARVNN